MTERVGVISYLENTKVEITELAKTVFYFACEYKEKTEQIKKLTKFTYEGAIYYIVRIKEDSTISGSSSFIVKVRKKD
jgi:hypothetical protein